jgi:hypothetical protein
MICFLLALVVLLPIGLGIYLLITGQIYLIFGSIRGPLARLIGLALIVSTIVCLPALLRKLAGMCINLGH